MNFNQTDFNRINRKHLENKIEMKSYRTLLKKLKKSKEKTEKDLEAFEKARIVIQQVAKITQDNLKYSISNLITTAMLSVNKEWPEFKMNIETRRNQSEIDFLFVENEQEQEPLESSGYGAIDIAADALSVSIWSLNKNRPTFIKDETFKHLSKDNSEKASKMLKMLCDKLNIQIIMVSHNEEIANFADNVFKVQKVKNESKIF